METLSSLFKTYMEALELVTNDYKNIKHCEQQIEIIKPSSQNVITYAQGESISKYVESIQGSLRRLEDHEPDLSIAEGDLFRVLDTKPECRFEVKMDNLSYVVYQSIGVKEPDKEHCMVIKYERNAL